MTQVSTPDNWNRVGSFGLRAPARTQMTSAISQCAPSLTITVMPALTCGKRDLAWALQRHMNDQPTSPLSRNGCNCANGRRSRNGRSLKKIGGFPKRLQRWTNIYPADPDGSGPGGRAPLGLLPNNGEFEGRKVSSPLQTATAAEAKSKGREPQS